MTTTTPPAAISAAPATIQLCAFLRELCDYSKRFDAFAESTDGAILRESGKYCDFDMTLHEAITDLSACVAPHLVDEYLKIDCHE